MLHSVNLQRKIANVTFKHWKKSLLNLYLIDRCCKFIWFW